MPSRELHPRGPTPSSLLNRPQNRPPPLSDVSWPAWLCPGRRFCLSPQLIIVACDQGQPAYETMQPLQVALDDIDDNEPIFLRPPVRHRGGGDGTQGVQGWGCRQACVMELSTTVEGSTMGFVHFQSFKEKKQNKKQTP